MSNRIHVVEGLDLDVLNPEQWTLKFGTEIPAGVLKTTSPITAKKETHYIRFTVSDEINECDHAVLEKLLHFHIRTWVVSNWKSQLSPDDPFELTEFLKTLNIDVLFEQLDIVCYEYTPSNALRLLPGVWVQFTLPKSPSPTGMLLCEFLDGPTHRVARLITLKGDWLKKQYSMDDLRTLFKVRWGETHSSEVHILPFNEGN